MKTLEEIKNEVAKEQGYLSYREVAEFSYGLGDIVAQRYAIEAIKADRENIKNQIKVRQCIYVSKGFYHPAESLIDITPIGLP